MAFAFGHLIAAWIIGLIIQKISNKRLSRLSWGLLFLGGLFPDIDFIFGNTIHRTITHSLLFVIIIFAVSYITFKNYNLERYAFLMPLGMLTHVILDLFSGPGTQVLYPLQSWIGIYNTTQLMKIPGMDYSIVLGILDMGLGFLWFVYLFLKNKISF